MHINRIFQDPSGFGGPAQRTLYTHIPFAHHIVLCMSGMIVTLVGFF